MDEVKQLIIHTLDEMFPDAYCELNYTNPFELLVAVILSAQTTDVSVNKVTPALFRNFKTPHDFEQAPLEEIEDAIKHLGLYKNKAKHIKNCSTMLIEKYQGQIPIEMHDLLELPGVGRKTANVYRSVALHLPAFAVDTHVLRISKRLGIAHESDNELVVEKKLMDYFPIQTWSKRHHQLIFFGRYHCFARNPKCDVCPLKSICTYPKKK